MKKVEREEKQDRCKCGCGRQIASKWDKYRKIEYIKGHGRKGKTNSKEHNEALRKANLKRIDSNCDYCKKSIFITPTRKKWKKHYCNKDCYRLGMIGRKLSPETIEKSRIYRIGRKVSTETRDKISLANSGEKNGSWNGGSSFEPYSLDFGRRFKRLVKIRDNDSCIICGSNNRLSVHHIDYNKLNTTKENCISLCSSCHSKTNFNRKYWKEFFQSMLSDKYGYIYIKLNEEAKNEMYYKEILD